MGLSINTTTTLAFSPSFPQDKIIYDSSIVATTVNAAAMKGRIMYREDANGNSADYDFRKVLFPRWETSTGSGIYAVLTDNGEDMNEFLTFAGTYPAGYVNNKLMPVFKTASLYGQDYPNIVFQNDAINTNINGLNNTFLETVSYCDSDGLLVGCGFDDDLSYCSFHGLIQSKIFDVASYAPLYANNYEKRVFSASDSKVYYSYFDGTNQVYDEII